MITPLRYVELTLETTDLPALLVWLGTEGEIQLESRTALPSSLPDDLAPMIREALDWLNAVPLEPGARINQDRPCPPWGAEERAQIETWARLALSEARRQRELEHQREETRSLVELLGHLAPVTRSLGELFCLRYTLPLLLPPLTAPQRTALEKIPGLVLLSSSPWLAVCLRSEQERIVRDLSSIPVDWKILSQEITAMHPDQPPGVQLRQALDRLQSLENDLDQIDRNRRILDSEARFRFQAALSALEGENKLRRETRCRQVSPRLTVIRGWVAEDRWGPTLTQTHQICRERVRIRTAGPSAVSEETPPTLLRHGFWTRGFARTVLAYGTPAYRGVDPAPWLTVSFPLLFGIMFGDLGQGLLIAALGVFLGTGRVHTLARWKPTAPAFVLCGLSSVFWGLLYGSCFSNEQVLVPLTRALTALGGPVRDRLLALVPDPGVEKLFLFFGFTLALGLGLLWSGQALHLTTCLRSGRTAEALFSSRGLAGSLFLAGGAAAAVLHLAGLAFSPWELLPFALLLVLMVRQGEARGPLGWTVEGFEIVTGFFTKTLSFLRVGAFALSHAVLGLCILTLADLAGGEKSGPGSLAVFLAGNLVILTLEALVVTIQVVRLHYYEFFSQFFTETGVLFRPFRLTDKEAS